MKSTINLSPQEDGTPCLEWFMYNFIIISKRLPLSIYKTFWAMLGMWEFGHGPEILDFGPHFMMEKWPEVQLPDRSDWQQEPGAPSSVLSQGRISAIMQLSLSCSWVPGHHSITAAAWGCPWSSAHPQWLESRRGTKPQLSPDLSSGGSVWLAEAIEGISVGSLGSSTVARI